MKFIKAEVNGNDFIIIETDYNQNLDIKKITDRRYGIGADQAIFVNKNNIVRFFNSDGSEARTCGNGLCAISKLRKKCTTFKTMENEYHVDNGSVIFPLPICIKEFNKYKIINTGNKHIVCIGEDSEMLQYNSEYNIHFIKKIKNNEIYIKTYERGAGKTLACGSGAIASAFAYGKHNSINHIIHEGGESQVELRETYIVLKTNPNIVFTGEF